MKRIIIGTAGHVDHGKTALTRYLTGVDTDRLAEEKKRGISIALGFAQLTIDDNLSAGIVDVPGHEKFIKTMLAGVAGIDMVLLVIAADEGVMPQTREHLDILSLLGVNKGVIVLSKIDLVDGEWLQMVRGEVKELLEGTPLAGAPVVGVSVVSGQGIPELLTAIKQVASAVTPRSAQGGARLPIDRSFTVSGFGTVVTGTLWAGTLSVGEYVELWPSGEKARIRSLQRHEVMLEKVSAGNRVAVNLVGVEVVDAPRGGWIAAPGLLNPNHRLDVELTLLPSVKALKHRSRVRLHHGTSEVFGRVHYFDREELAPGESCFAQLQLETPLMALRGDQLILRSYSPMQTIAGAKVIDNQALRHKRYKEDILAELSLKSRGVPEDLLAAALDNAPEVLCGVEEAAAAAGLTIDEVKNAMADERLVVIKDENGAPWLAAAAALARLWQEAAAWLTQAHKSYPLRFGAAKEELKSRILPTQKQRSFALLLAFWQEKGLIKTNAREVALAGHEVTPPPQLAKWRAKVAKELLDSGFAPPAWSTLAGLLPEAEQKEALLWLTGDGVAVRLTDEIVMHGVKVAEAVNMAKDFLQKNGEMTLGQYRDILQTSRKYTLALLDYLDACKITKRKDDARVLY